MGKYTQKFTLLEIFNNKKLRDKIPLVNYKEKVDEEGKVHRTTNMKSISRFVFDKSVSAARPFYSPLTPHKAGNEIYIEGTLVGDHDEAVEAVYQKLVTSVPMMKYIANNADMIRSALKETEKSGASEKLYLRYNSMLEIENLSDKEMQKFVNDIMQNIFFGNYPKTQKKYGVERLSIGNHFSYADNKVRWERKVGIL